MKLQLSASIGQHSKIPPLAPHASEMRIFLSWSGETSRAIADALRQWLPSVIQASRPYFSPDDITKGTRWSTEIALELSESKLGLICLTPENLDASWIMFEAGALSKNIGATRVIPLLFGVDLSDLVGPMTQFQAAQFSQEEMRRVVVAINSELADQRLAPEVVQDVFAMWWPRLEQRVAAILAEARPTEDTPARSEKDILEEVLALTRTMSRGRVSEHRDGVSFAAVEEVLISINSLLDALRGLAPATSPALYDAVEALEKPMMHMSNVLARSGRTTRPGIPSRPELEAAFEGAKKALDEDLPF